MSDLDNIIQFPTPERDDDAVPIPLMRRQLIASEVHRPDVRAVIGDEHANTIIEWLQVRPEGDSA